VRVEAADRHLLFPLVVVLGKQLNRSAAALHGGDALGLGRRLGVVDVDLDVRVAICRASAHRSRDHHDLRVVVGGVRPADLLRERQAPLRRVIHAAIVGAGHAVRLVARVLPLGPMGREITQRELRNESGGIMRALDRGETFVVTRNGVPVGELTPFRRRQFVAPEAAVAIFAGAPAIEAERFRADVDAFLDQDPTPRA
jgi:antitoxin (DNA-binding transcriptional repressor) of toxin-antitoxin stability system